MKTNFLNVLTGICFISFLLSGCAAAELAEAISAADVETVATGESALLRSGTLRISAEGVIAEDLTTLNSGLRRIRLAPGNSYSAAPRLLYTVNGETKAIAEVVSENSLRLIKTGKIIRFPEGKIYTVKNKYVNIRSKTGVNDYKVFTHIEKNELVLVLNESNGWSEVEFGKGQTGYIKSSLLISALLSQVDHPGKFSTYNSSKKIDVTGLWSGIVTLNDGQTCSYTLELTQESGNLEGTISLSTMNKIYFTNYRIKGKLFNNKVYVQGYEYINNNPGGGYNWCMASLNLIFSETGEDKFLTGSWGPNSIAGGCPNGNGYVELKKEEK